MLSCLRLLRRASCGAMLILLAATACGGGDDDAAATDSHCLAIKDQYDQVHRMCCKQPSEKATSSLGCGLHVAIGCEGDLACTFYTDDGLVTYACMSAPTCRECGQVGDTGLDLWCHDRIADGD